MGLYKNGKWQPEANEIAAGEYMEPASELSIVRGENERLRARVAELENPWVSVKDQLPDDGQKILCRVNRGDPFVAKYSATDKSYAAENFTGAFLGWLQYDQTYAVITLPTHWMPIPLKGESDE